MTRSRLLAIAVPVAVAALLTAALAFVPAQATPEPSVEAVPGRTSVACPNFASATATAVTAVSPGPDLTVEGVGNTSPSLMPGEVTVVRNTSATRVSGSADLTFGGTSMATAASGPYRGVTMSQCQTPTTESWLTGVVSNDSFLTDLVLINLDNAEAAVDLTFYGADGETTAAGARGILVGANSQRSISLKPLVSQAAAMTIHVETSQGRVAAFARETIWQGTNPVGTDWITPSVSGHDVVVPGVPAGSGSRLLVVGNPGERSITVDITVQTANGPVSLQEAAELDVPARSTRTVSLEGGLAQAAASVRVSGGTDITAAVRSLTASPGASSDVAVSSAQSSLSAKAVFPVAPSSKGTAALILSGSPDKESKAKISFANELGKELGKAQEVTLAEGASMAIAVPRAPVVAISIETTSGSVWGAVAVSVTMGKVLGLGIVSSGGRLGGTQPTIVQDPHVDEASGD